MGQQQCFHYSETSQLAENANHANVFYNEFVQKKLKKMKKKYILMKNDNKIAQKCVGYEIILEWILTTMWLTKILLQECYIT